MAETSHAETVVLGVEDHLSAGARAAEGALARLEAQIIREQGALSRLESNLNSAKGALKGIGSGDNGVVNVAAYRRAQGAVTSLGDRMAGQKDKIDGLRDRMEKLRHGTDNAAHAAHAAHPPFRAMGQAARMLGGEAGQLTAELTHAAHILLKLGPFLAAAIVGFVALTGIFVGFVEVVKRGIEGASEYRDELIELSSAGVTLRNSLRASMTAAEGLYEAIEHVARKSATSVEEVKSVAVELRNARFTGHQLESALETAALVSAGGGKKMAQQYLEVAKNVRFLGGNIDQLGERMKKKFGAVAEAKLLSVSVQVKKLKEEFAYLFTGADIEPFLKGLHSVFSLFDRDTDSAKSLRDMITKVTETGIGLMLRFVLILVKSYIWLQNHETVWGTIKLAIKGVAIAVGLLAGAMAVSFALIAVNIGIVVLAIGAVGAAIGWVANQFVWLYNNAGEAWAGVKAMFNDALAWLKAIDLVSIGKAMILGLADGITSAAKAVYDSLKNAVKGAIDGVKNFLESHSPSGLLRRTVGYDMGAGVALGNDDAAPEVAKASKGMVQAGVEAAGSVSAPAPIAGTGGGGHQVTFTNCQFGDNSEGALRKAILSILEGETFRAPEPA